MLQKLIACLIAQVAISATFEFCADNQLFSFSKEQCPGGVFLKHPMELTEPCHCISKHLVVYSIGNPNAQMKNNSIHPKKVCRRFDSAQRKHGGALIRLLQPVKRAVEHEFVHFRHKDSKCRKARKKCTKAAPTSFTKHHRQKRDTSISYVTDDKLRERIQETIDLLNELQFGGPSSVKPKSMSFQLLAKTLKIYKFITPKVIVEGEVINSIFTLFLKKYADMELPSYSGRLTVDDQVDNEMFENVMGSLQECASRASDPSQEFEFVTSKDVCPLNVTHVVRKVSTMEAGFERLQYELGKFMPEDRKYIPGQEDFILGALWKAFDAVYSYCFSTVFSYRTSETLNNYFTIISNIFTSPWTANDYLAANNQGTQMYSSRIEHDNLTKLMNNMDYMTEAVHILSRYKTFFKKPVSHSKHDSRLKRKMEITTTEPVASTVSESPIFSNRNKRSIRKDQSVFTDWADIEIWEGQAYCLQVSNPALPASIANTFPIANFVDALKFEVLSNDLKT